MKIKKPKKKVKNPWLIHLKKFHVAHPKMSYAEAMSAARKSYKKIK